MPLESEVTEERVHSSSLLKRKPVPSYFHKGLDETRYGVQSYVGVGNIGSYTHRPLCGGYLLVSLIAHWNVNNIHDHNIMYIIAVNTEYP